MKILLLELFAFLCLFAATALFHRGLAFEGFVLLFLMSGVWKNQPITPRSAALGLIIHIAIPLLGFFLLMLMWFGTGWSDLVGLVASYFVASVVYFIVHEDWALAWRFGAIITAPLVLAITYGYLFPFTSANIQMAELIFPLLVWRVIELTHACFVKMRSGQA
jgi:hypothetical protein